jgi:hypothetical protein
MNTTEFSSSFSRDRAMEIAVAAAGHKFIHITRLRSPEARSHHFPAKTDAYSIALLDVTIDVSGALRLIEANGSNGASTSLSAGGDNNRAAHMCATLEARHPHGEKAVALLGHQAGFLLIPEFFRRAECFHEKVSGVRRSALRAPEEPLGDEDLTVVAGELGAIASHCAAQQGRLFYRGRPVVFGTNTNLVPELARQSRIHYHEGDTDLMTDFFHEGKLVPLIHDKYAQQRVAAGTGIVPLLCTEVYSRDACLSEVHRLRSSGTTLFLKMNGGSGGAGIEILPGRLTESKVKERWDALITSATQKYGPAIDKTIYPVRIFEFARSTDYLVAGKPHLWDLRVQCLISPGSVDVAPVLIRLCPEPFDERVFSRDSVVSNLTGREPSLRYVRSPWRAADCGTGSVLEQCGFTPEIYDRLLRACVAWCEHALSSDGHGKTST